MIPAVKKAQIEYLNEKGYSVSEIATMLDLSRIQVCNYRCNNKLKKNGKGCPNFESVRARYDNGSNIEALAAEIGVSRSRLSFHAFDHKWKPRGHIKGVRSPMTRETMQRIITLYEDGNSVYKICQKLHLGAVRVNNFLTAVGLKKQKFHYETRKNNQQIQ